MAVSIESFGIQCNRLLWFWFLFYVLCFQLNVLQCYYFLNSLYISMSNHSFTFYFVTLQIKLNRINLFLYNVLKRTSFLFTCITQPILCCLIVQKQKFELHISKLTANINLFICILVICDFLCYGQKVISDRRFNFFLKKKRSCFLNFICSCIFCT